MHARTHSLSLSLSLCVQLLPADNLSKQFGPRSGEIMTKSMENIPACNELNPLAMDLIGRLNTSEFVNGEGVVALVS